jgi:hypothetical protein
VSVISLVAQAGITIAMKAISTGAIIDKACVHSSYKVGQNVLRKP